MFGALCLFSVGIAKPTRTSTRPPHQPHTAPCPYEYEEKDMNMSPSARRDDVIEDYHGVKVADPYRWLEDPAAPDTLAWVEAQNAITEQYIASIPAREGIRTRMTALWDYPKYSVPSKKGAHYFFSKNSGLQNQSVLYKQDSLQDEAKVVIDPNILSEDGTTALITQSFSKDGTLLAYGLSEHGSDWQEIRMREVENAFSTSRMRISCQSLPCSDSPYASNVPSLLNDWVMSAVVPSSLRILGSITTLASSCRLSCL